MPEGSGGDAFLSQTARLMRDEFRIGHSTFQIEQGACADEDVDCSHVPHAHAHDHHDH